MSNGLLALFAFTPILLAAVMLIGLRWPASRAMPLVYLFTAAIGLFVWDWPNGPTRTSSTTC